MADERKKKLQLVDLAGIGNLLEHLVAEDAISCDERDRIIQKIARDNDLAEHTLPILAGYGRSESEVLERTNYKESTKLQYHRTDESYISLTDIARAHSDMSVTFIPTASQLRTEIFSCLSQIVHLWSIITAWTGQTQYWNVWKKQTFSAGRCGISTCCPIF